MGTETSLLSPTGLVLLRALGMQTPGTAGQRQIAGRRRSLIKPVRLRYVALLPITSYLSGLTRFASVKLPLAIGQSAKCSRIPFWHHCGNVPRSLEVAGRSLQQDSSIKRLVPLSSFHIYHRILKRTTHILLATTARQTSLFTSCKPCCICSPSSSLPSPSSASYQLRSARATPIGPMAFAAASTNAHQAAVQDTGESTLLQSVESLLIDPCRCGQR